MNSTEVAELISLWRADDRLNVYRDAIRNGFSTGTGTSYPLYAAQLTSMNVLLAACDARAVPLLDELAVLGSYSFGWLYGPGRVPWDGGLGPTAVSALTWPEGSGTPVVENLNNTVQWTYWLATLLRCSAQVPAPQRTAALTQFLTTGSAILYGLLQRLVWTSAPAFGATFDGWSGCHPPATGALSSEELLRRKLTRSLPQLPDAPCNLALDWDVQLLGSAAEYVVARRLEPGLHGSTTDDARLLSYVELGASLLASQLVYPVNPTTQDTTALAWPGAWSTHDDFQYAGQTLGFRSAVDARAGLLPPLGQLAPVATVGEDLGHFVRWVYVLRTLHRHRALLALDFPADSTLVRLGRQLSQRVFNGDLSLPEFANFMDGSNGWFRHQTPSRAGPFSNGGAAVVQGGYLLLAEWNPTLAQVRARLETLLAESPTGLDDAGIALRRAALYTYAEPCSFDGGLWHGCAVQLDRALSRVERMSLLAMRGQPRPPLISAGPTPFALVRCDAGCADAVPSGCTATTPWGVRWVTGTLVTRSGGWRVTEDVDGFVDGGLYPCVDTPRWLSVSAALAAGLQRCTSSDAGCVGDVFACQTPTGLALGQGQWSGAQWQVAPTLRGAWLPCSGAVYALAPGAGGQLIRRAPTDLAVDAGVAYGCVAATEHLGGDPFVLGRLELARGRWHVRSAGRLLECVGPVVFLE